MKQLFFILMFTGLVNFSWAQENMITVSGGYAFANMEYADDQGTGYRINGLYEFNPLSGAVAHGISFGYMKLVAERDILNVPVKSTINSFPIYYAPKFMFGNEKIKGFVKGALGMQFAWLKREALVELKDNDFGFYTGAGAGFMFNVSENVFINAEYEIAWVSNSFYDNGWVNSVMGGVGIKF